MHRGQRPFQQFFLFIQVGLTIKQPHNETIIEISIDEKLINIHHCVTTEKVPAKVPFSQDGGSVAR